MNEPPAIAGLRYLPDFITASEEMELLHWIDQQPWLTDLKRRVQHYGYRYDYKARNISRELQLGALPEQLEHYTVKLAENLFANKPDQVIVNEYLPGQGISSHTDCIPCFGPTIVSLSLGSSCVMDFEGPEDDRHTLLLEPRSLLLLSDDARYRWKHSIAARKSDRIHGSTIKRERRVSLTFRSVILT
ncbi:MAG: alpha-ketoglutarate-dependent dioxygenase AlkB [Azospirillum brasilense]|nr:MAG: alpha-ketoglutarate-dependent dioxygenase AlkB [Azospirillum brasilense]